MSGADNGTASIDGEAIVIRVSFDALAQVVDGAWALGSVEGRWKVTDPAVFSAALVDALNQEDEQGTTPIHRIFDDAINDAIENGAEGIKEHEDQDEAHEDQDS